MQVFLRKIVLIFAIISLVFLISCNNSLKEQEVENSTVSATNVDSLNKSIFDSTSVAMENNKSLKFEIGKLINFDVPKLFNSDVMIDIGALYKKKDSAIETLNYIINTQEFKNEVLASYFTRRSKNRQTNLEIYQRLSALIRVL